MMRDTCIKISKRIILLQNIKKCQELYDVLSKKGFSLV